jgi:hypothetical protein
VVTRSDRVDRRRKPRGAITHTLQVPSVVLTEALNGDHRDFAVNRLLRACQVRDVTELLARDAARLRGATRRAGTITATDAIVVAFASACGAPVILTGAPKDVDALADHAQRLIIVSAT